VWSSSRSITKATEVYSLTLLRPVYPKAWFPLLTLAFFRTWGIHNENHLLGLDFIVKLERPLLLQLPSGIFDPCM